MGRRGAATDVHNAFTDTECRKLRRSLVSKSTKDLKVIRGKTQSKKNYQKSKGRTRDDLNAELLIVQKELTRRKYRYAVPQWIDPLPSYIVIYAEPITNMTPTLETSTSHNTITPPPSLTTSTSPNTMTPPPSLTTSTSSNTMTPPPSLTTYTSSNIMTPPPSLTTSTSSNTMTPPPSLTTPTSSNTMTPSTSSNTMTPSMLMMSTSLSMTPLTTTKSYNVIPSNNMMISALTNTTSSLTPPLVTGTNTKLVTGTMTTNTIDDLVPSLSIEIGVELPRHLCSSLTNTHSEFSLLVADFERLQLEPHLDDEEVSLRFAQQTMHVNHLRKIASPSIYIYAEILHLDLCIELMSTNRALRKMQEEKNLTKQRILQDTLARDLLLVDHLDNSKLFIPHSFLRIGQGGIRHNNSTGDDSELLLIDKEQLVDKFSHFPMQAHEYRRNVDMVKLEEVIHNITFHRDHIQQRKRWAVDQQSNGKQSFDHLLQCVIEDRYPLEQVMYRQFCLCRLCVVDLPELKGKLILPLPCIPTLSLLPAKRTSFWRDHSNDEFNLEVAEEYFNELEGGVSDMQIGKIVTRDIVHDTNNLLSTFCDQVSASCKFFNRHDVFYPRGLDPKLVDVEIWIRFLFTYSKTPPRASSDPHVSHIHMNYDHTKLYINMSPGPINEDEMWIVLTSKHEMLLNSSWSTWRELQQDGILIKPEKFFHVPASEEFIDASLDEIEAGEKLDATMERQAAFKHTTVEAIARRTVTETRRVVEIVNGREVTQEATIKTVQQLTYRVENRLCRRRREFQNWQSKWNQAYNVFLKDREFATSGVNGLKTHMGNGAAYDEEKKRKCRDNAKHLPHVDISSTSPVKSKSQQDKEKLMKEIRSINLDFRNNIANCERELRLARMVELQDEIVKFLAWTHDEVRTIGLHALKGSDWKTLAELAVMSDVPICDRVIQVFPGPLGRITAPISWTRHCDSLLLPHIKQKQSKEESASVFKGLHDKDIREGLGVRRASRKLQDAHKQARDVEKQLMRAFRRMYI